MIFDWTSKPEKLAAWTQQVKCVDKYGTKFWYKNGVKHRDGDQPAVISADGYRAWYKNGKLVARSQQEFNQWKASQKSI